MDVSAVEGGLGMAQGKCAGTRRGAQSNALNGVDCPSYLFKRLDCNVVP